MIGCLYLTLSHTQTYAIGLDHYYPFQDHNQHSIYQIHMEKREAKMWGFFFYFIKTKKFKILAQPYHGNNGWVKQLTSSCIATTCDWRTLIGKHAVSMNKIEGCE